MQKTNFPVEILIHDDASSDQTASIVRDYAIRYPDLIKPIFQLTNQYSKGRKINQEFNFSRARGDFIAICDGDDYWTDETKLQRQAECLVRNSDVVLCYGGVIAVDENDERVYPYKGGALRDLSPQELEKATRINTSTAFFRNIDLGLPRELQPARIEDLTYWSRLAEFGSGKYISEIKPSAYRIHVGGILSKKTGHEKSVLAQETYFALYLYHYNRRPNSPATSHFARDLVCAAAYRMNFGDICVALGFLGMALLKRTVMEIRRLPGRSAREG